MRYLVLFGAPGSGKGTQAAPLASKLGLLHVSSGDLFRDNLTRGSDLGQIAKGYMDRGELVPDDVTIAMVLDRIAQPDAANGAILDGFPRTMAQGQGLDTALAARARSVECAIYLEVPDEELLVRLSGRWLCRNCGASFHELFAPPRSSGVCDVCQGDLYQRTDDTRETAIRRLAVFRDQTAPLIAYYRSQEKLCTVPGTGEIEAIAASLVAATERCK